MNLVVVRERYKVAVVHELEHLLARARRGEIIGIGYAIMSDEREINAGLAGLMAKDRLKAAGVMLSASMRAAEAMEE